jgi:hypothetical protein
LEVLRERRGEGKKGEEGKGGVGGWNGLSGCFKNYVKREKRVELSSKLTNMTHIY